MTWFETTLYGGIGFFTIMGVIMLVVNLKMRHELNKPDSEQHSPKGVESE